MMKRRLLTTRNAQWAQESLDQSAVGDSGPAAVAAVGVAYRTIARKRIIQGQLPVSDRDRTAAVLYAALVIAVALASVGRAKCIKAEELSCGVGHIRLHIAVQHFLSWGAAGPAVYIETH